MRDELTPYAVFTDARAAICSDPEWQGHAMDGVPSLMDAIHMLDRAQSHLGILGCRVADGQAGKFFAEGQPA